MTPARPSTSPSTGASGSRSPASGRPARASYGGGVRPFGWGVDTGRVRSVCVNPKAPPMERVYEDRPVLDMTRHNEAEADEIRRWADDLLSGVSMNQRAARPGRAGACPRWR